MKKKISVFTLLLSLLLAVLVPFPVKAANSTETTADDVKYTDIEDFMHGAGYYEFVKQEGVTYFALLDGDYLYLYEHYGSNIYMGYTGSEFWSFSNKKVMCYKYYNFTKASQLEDYSCLQSFEVNSYSKPLCGKGAYYNEALSTYYLFQGSLDVFVYTDMPIYSVTNVSTSSNSMSFYKDTSVVLFESTKYDGYVFPVWCADASLNCLASSNESPTVIPYSYNSYWHIVRRTSNGKWLLITIGNSLGQEDVQVRFTEDNGALMLYNSYSGEDINGYMVNVRQYEYDTDGWKVRTYETFDAREYENGIIELGAGTGVDSTRVVAYTNTDIYSFNGYALMHEASTEYVEITDTPVVTPTTAPDSGGSDSGSSGSDDSGSSGSGSSGGGRPGIGTRPSVGGEASGGGGLDFIINLFTLIWTKICSVPMAVDGYSISLQQIFVYGALVSIIGGFIIKLIFRR